MAPLLSSLLPIRKTLLPLVVLSVLYRLPPVLTSSHICGVRLSMASLDGPTKSETQSGTRDARLLLVPSRSSPWTIVQECMARGWASPIALHLSERPHRKLDSSSACFLSLILSRAPFTRDLSRAVTPAVRRQLVMTGLQCVPSSGFVPSAFPLIPLFASGIAFDTLISTHHRGVRFVVSPGFSSFASFVLLSDLHLDIPLDPFPYGGFQTGESASTENP